MALLGGRVTGWCGCGWVWYGFGSVTEVALGCVWASVVVLCNVLGYVWMYYM